MFPNCIGLLLLCKKKESYYFKTNYSKRKCNKLLLLLGESDNNILNFSCGAPGLTSDNDAYKKSNLRNKIIKKKIIMPKRILSKHKRGKNNNGIPCVFRAEDEFRDEYVVIDILLL